MWPCFLLDRVMNYVCLPVFILPYLLSPFLPPYLPTPTYIHPLPTFCMYLVCLPANIPICLLLCCLHDSLFCLIAYLLYVCFQACMHAYLSCQLLNLHACLYVYVFLPVTFKLFRSENVFIETLRSRKERSDIKIIDSSENDIKTEALSRHFDQFFTLSDFLSSREK